MDPVSQGAFGTIFAQIISNKKKLIVGSILGCLAGLAPDLDVLIRSNSDPLLKLEFHRQFTHSLVFIPIGALIVSLSTQFFFKKYLSWKEAYLFCLFGYATHGLLDACTSYGTQLLWPFSNERFSWNNISVVDPFLTVPILIFIIIAITKKNKLISFFGIIYIFLFLGIGVLQKNRAEEAGKFIANIRGHEGSRLTVKPSLGNLLLWKVIYENKGYYYVDAVRLLSETEHCQGTSIRKLNTLVDFDQLSKDSQQYKDIKRFSWFSQDYLGVGKDKNTITDVRYSAIPNEIDGLWGIKIDISKNDNEHVEWITNRNNFRAKWEKFLSLLLGKGCKKLI